MVLLSMNLIRLGNTILLFFEYPKHPNENQGCTSKSPLGDGFT